jgi:predicted DNA-binding transcriptional regulator AlpA
MTAQPNPGLPKPGSLSPLAFVLLTPTETAKRLQVSLSRLAKARMRGDGPPFIKIGRSIRYSESALLQWTKAHQRLSTSEQ